MSFKKAGEYLLKIFCEEQNDKDFHMFFSTDNYGFAGGFLEDGEKYKLLKNRNMSGLKIGDGKYIFLQTRMPFVQSLKCQQIFDSE